MEQPKTVVLASVDRGYGDPCQFAAITALRADIARCFEIVDEMQPQGVAEIAFWSPYADWYACEGDHGEEKGGLSGEAAERILNDEERFTIDASKLEGVETSRTEADVVVFSRTHVWWRCIPKHEDNPVETVPLTREEALRLFSGDAQ